VGDERQLARQPAILKPHWLPPDTSLASAKNLTGFRNFIRLPVFPLFSSSFQRKLESSFRFCRHVEELDPSLRWDDASNIL
jgi:hypothetical protein